MNPTEPRRAGIFDLRQYTLRPGRRDELIDLFDEHFVAGQEAVGIHVVGQYRDLDDPDRFVWLRGFDSWPARGKALPAFYHGPVWQAHRDRANATMLDSDDALLLSPLWLGPSYPAYGTPRPDGDDPTSVVGITVVQLDQPADDAVRGLLLDALRPLLTETGAEPVAMFVTDPSPNNFPALPLRDENVVVWINRFENDDAHTEHQARLAESRTWRTDVRPKLSGAARSPARQLRLRPTGRSQLR